MSLTKHVGALLLGLLLSSSYAKSENAKINAPKMLYVEIDDISTNKFGSWPLSRIYYAKAIAKARSAGAKAVLIKIFFEKDSDGTHDLADEMTKMPVLIQAELQFGPLTSGEHTAAAPFRYFGDVSKVMHASGLAMPIREIAANAKAIGFAQTRAPEFPDLIERVATVGPRVIPSLQLLAAEQILGKSEVAGNWLRFAKKKIKLDAAGRIVCHFPNATALQPIGLSSFLHQTYGPNDLRGTVVVVAYGRSDSPCIAIHTGEMVPVHQYFGRQLACLID